MTNDFLGLRFMPTTEAYVQASPTVSGLNIRRPIIVGQGSLIEGNYAGMAAADADHCAVLVLDRGLHDPDRHQHQLDDDPDRDQQRL